MRGGTGGPIYVRSGLSSDFGVYTPRVNNGSPARKKDEFANADAKKWFAFRRLLENRQVILPVDGELLKQLSSRRLQYDAKARIQLEPKESMRSRALNSPAGPMRSSAQPLCPCQDSPGASPWILSLGSSLGGLMVVEGFST
jgi:hypothetical protein